MDNTKQIVDAVVKEAIELNQFKKHAAKFEDLSYEAQKKYLEQHKGSRKKLTKKPGEGGKPLSALKEDIESKRQEINQEKRQKFDVEKDHKKVFGNEFTLDSQWDAGEEMVDLPENEFALDGYKDGEGTIISYRIQQPGPENGYKFNLKDIGTENEYQKDEITFPVQFDNIEDVAKYVQDFDQKNNSENYSRDLIEQYGREIVNENSDLKSLEDAEGDNKELQQKLMDVLDKKNKSHIDHKRIDEYELLATLISQDRMGFFDYEDDD